MSDAKDDEIEVGYGQPPSSGQFKKGQSGNLKGRPKKHDPSVVDLDTILTNEVQANGAPMDAREAELRIMVKKALEPKGSLKIIRHLLTEFERHGAIVAQKRLPAKLELPEDVPWAVTRIALSMHGAPPWSATKLNAAKLQYLAERNDGDRIYDQEMGYEEWLNE